MSALPSRFGGHCLLRASHIAWVTSAVLLSVNLDMHYRTLRQLRNKFPFMHFQETTTCVRNGQELAIVKDLSQRNTRASALSILKTVTLRFFRRTPYRKNGASKKILF